MIALALDPRLSPRSLFFFLRNVIDHSVRLSTTVAEGHQVVTVLLLTLNARCSLMTLPTTQLMRWMMLDRSSLRTEPRIK